MGFCMGSAMRTMTEGSSAKRRLISSYPTATKSNSRARKSGPVLEADPVKDLRTWKRRCSQDSGATVDRAIIGAIIKANVVDPLLAKLKDKLDTRRIDLGFIKPEQLAGGVTYYFVYFPLSFADESSFAKCQFALQMLNHVLSV